MKGYFRSNMPLLIQDMVAGSLSIKRKHSRRGLNPYSAKDEQKPTSTHRTAEP